MERADWILYLMYTKVNRMQPLSVSQFIQLINNLVGFEQLAVEGEVSGFSISQGKFVFFSLKDEGAVVECFAMTYAIGVPLKDGMKVRVWGTPGLYAKSGRFRITVSSVELLGEGALQAAYIALKKKLESEGLFAIARKRTIPRFVSHVAFIGSKTSAAYTDFVRVAHNRWGGVLISVYDVRVQGESAAMDIVGAFAYFNARASEEHSPDVLVLSRGGGSLEDLQSFNDERVARAVFGSLIPVVVGVGHERDETLVDFVADIRASTPSNAAERIFPDRVAVSQELRSFGEFLSFSVDSLVHKKKTSLTSSLFVFEQGVGSLIKNARMQMNTIITALPRIHTQIQFKKTQVLQIITTQEQQVRQVVERYREKISFFYKTISLLSPQALLARGYSIVTRKNGILLTSARDVARGEEISIRMHDGDIDVTVQ